MQRSPILKYESFIPPLKCQSGNILEFVEYKFPSIQESIEKHFDVEIDNIFDIHIGDIIKKPTCDNSIYNKKWIINRNSDFTGYIPLRTYNNNVPFDIETEVYGGELFFMNFGYHYYPSMGDLLIYPSSPNFVHFHKEVLVGGFNYIKFYIRCSESYIHQYTKFNNNLL